MDKKRLQNYIYLRREIENQQERLARMKNEESYPRPGWTAGVHSILDRQMIVWQMRLFGALNMKVRLQTAWRASELKWRLSVGRLPSCKTLWSARCYDCGIVDVGYCRHMPWRDVALKIYGDDDEGQMQAVYRLHGRALQSIREIEA